ncbi:MAG: hypothetical protein SCARUB_02129 [Candidatus Scalindua rubra]|uniref:Tetratricopeptide repeat protein n=1 Tax=Candidatus Scalindua rubra TaxID=1872076 RepID=A0A1E3XAT5_9BACT|nr:MAG: hypothetical protein SCARUB_02129 [Candidatus Scalindua rubra]
MKYITKLLLIISIVSFSSSVWAASCELCYEKISGDEKYCEQCKLKFSRNLSEMKSKEEHIINAINSSRESYKNALMELVQFYLDIGYQLRLEKVRKELKALNKVPQPKYLTVKEKVTNVKKPIKNIEDANILFQDGKTYKSSLSVINKKTNLLTAVKRFKKLMDDYPESDKVDDAAYELAGIYEGFYFKDYEGAAFYYVKCYEINPTTDKPARYMAARVYDMYLKDYAEAVRNYELALETCKIEEYLEITKSRLDELRKQGY